MWVNGTAGISWGGPYNQAGELIIGMIIIIMHENVIDLGIFLRPSVIVTWRVIYYNSFLMSHRIYTIVLKKYFC